MTALPASLVRFRSELEASISRELRASQRTRRRVLVRGAVVTAAAAAVAVGALTVLPGDPAGRFVEPASAAQRAAAALAASEDSIVHVSMLVVQRNPDGSQTRWREESWQATAPPYDRRQIVTGADGRAIETATVDAEQQLYDPASNTVVTGLVGGGAVPATPEPATGEPFREQVLDLLRGGKLTASGRSVVDGRRTISFAWVDGQVRYEYTVDAATYRPVRWRISPTAAGASATTVTFDAYEVLAADAIPLDLTRVHPEAKARHRP